MPRFRVPPEIETDQLLGRAQLGVFLDNDRFFNGLGDRWRVIPKDVYGGVAYGGTFTGGEPRVVLWDGYHLLRSDATMLHFSMWCTGDSGVTLKAFYDSTPGQDGEVTQKIGEIVSGEGGDFTYDLTQRNLTTPGLYRVYFRLDRTGTADPARASGAGTILAPYTSYTGDYAFQQGHEIADERTSSEDHFNRWRDNDIYFNAITSPQPAFISCVGSFRPDDYVSKKETIWSGYAWGVGYTRLYYHLGIKSDDSLNKDDCGIHVYYDDVEVATIQPENTDKLTAESYVDIDIFYQRYERKRVDVILERDGIASERTDADVTVYYLFVVPRRISTAYVPPDPGISEVGQWVYGNTGGQNSALSWLTSWDRDIDLRMARYDYAVRSCGTGESYRLKRRGDILYYKGENIEMTWGVDERLSLDDVTEGYGQADLIDIDSFPYGVVYELSGDGIPLFALEA